jgi:anti-sigma factor RsiW
MTHLGQRLSALIDGELDCDERERVLGHLARCGWCREEAAALRTLKRRMNALGETVAGAALTGRLMGLSSEGGLWPQTANGWSSGSGSGSGSGGGAHPDVRSAARYFLAGSVAVFLAGLGTAAFIAGGDPQVESPAPTVTPPAGVMLLEHDHWNGLNVNSLLGPGSGNSRSKSQSTTLP